MLGVYWNGNTLRSCSHIVVVTHPVVSRFRTQLFFFFCTSVCRYKRSYRHLCGMFVKCIFVVKCEVLHFFTRFSTFIVLHAPRRCLPHVASSNEVCACSSQEAIFFRNYRTTFAQPIGSFFPFNTWEQYDARNSKNRVEARPKINWWRLCCFLFQYENTSLLVKGTVCTPFWSSLQWWLLQKMSNYKTPKNSVNIKPRLFIRQ